MSQAYMTLERDATLGQPTPSRRCASSQQASILYSASQPIASKLRDAPGAPLAAVAPPEANAFVCKLLSLHEAAISRLAGLTMREHEIMELIVAGEPNKNVAVDLHISQRTVENHRASIMKKAGVKSLPALVRLALLATWIDLVDLSS